MSRRTLRTAGALVLLALAVAPAARGQDPPPTPEAPPAPTTPTVPTVPPNPPDVRKGRDQGRMPRARPLSRRQSRMAHVGHREPPTGTLGPYLPSRESSGTAWQPESSVHEGWHFPNGRWNTVVHAWATAVWDDQGGARGDQQLFGANMMMGRMHGPFGPGTLGFRVMLSAEPGTIGSEGYPLLLQTGESADGVTPLVDRQHPHDLTMELATTYYVSPDRSGSLFFYGGLPGEPALGPAVFMHRFSGESFPDAPIGHHWLDSSHITYGVLTAGVVDGPWKLEGSLFRGREPDHLRTDIEKPDLDSHSFRISNNPSPNLALQGSYGRLHSPDALEPGVDVDRTTVSATMNSVGPGRMMQTTVAWGRNQHHPGSELDAFLIETCTRLGGRHTWLFRIERVEKDDLFSGTHPLTGQTFQVGKLSAGYRYDLWPGGPVTVGIGGLFSLCRLPDALDPDYGSRPLAGMGFVRAALR